MDLIKTYSPKHLSILSAVATHVRDVLVLQCSVEDLLADLEYLHKCVSSVRVKWQAISKGIGVTGREAYRWYNEVHVRKLFRGIMTNADRQALQEIILAGIYDRSILLPNFRKIARTKLGTEYPLQIFTMTYNNLLRSKVVREALIYEKVILPMRPSANQATRSSSGAPNEVITFGTLPPISEFSPMMPLPPLAAMPARQQMQVQMHPSFSSIASMGPQQHMHQPIYNIEPLPYQSPANPFIYRAQTRQLNQMQLQPYAYNYQYMYPTQQPVEFQAFSGYRAYPASPSEPAMDSSRQGPSFGQDSNSSCSGPSLFDEIVSKNDASSALISSGMLHGDLSSGSNATNALDQSLEEKSLVRIA